MSRSLLKIILAVIIACGAAALAANPARVNAQEIQPECGGAGTPLCHTGSTCYGIPPAVHCSTSYDYYH